MLDQGSKKSTVQIWVGITLIAGLLGLAGGLGLASTVLDTSGGSGLKADLRDSQARVSQLQADLEEVNSASQVLAEKLAGATQKEDDLRMQLSQAEARASSALQALTQKVSELELTTSAQEQLQSIQTQLAKEQANLTALREMSDAVERHRLLLVELRKDTPQTREESTTYWRNIKTLAARANPALASPADRVILKIDNYFNWNDRSPSPTGPTDEYFNAYFDWRADYNTSGAIAYEDAVITFTRDALLAVITQMDSVVSRLN
jgi:hypothetical protein